MTEQTNAELIADVRSIDVEWVLDNSADDAVETIRELAAALEDAEEDRETLAQFVRHYQDERDALAAVVEKVRGVCAEASEASDRNLATTKALGYASLSTRQHVPDLNEVRDILAAAPADVLAERDAEKWGEGFDVGSSHGIAYQAGDNDSLPAPGINPYRQKREEQS